MVQKTNRRSSEWQFCVPCWWQRAKENSQTESNWQEDYNNSKNYFLQTWWAEQHLRMPYLRLQKQKTTLGFTPFCQEQESVAAVGTDSQTHQNRQVQIGKRPKVVKSGWSTRLTELPLTGSVFVFVLCIIFFKLYRLLCMKIHGHQQLLNYSNQSIWHQPLKESHSHIFEMRSHFFHIQKFDTSLV